MKVLITGMTSRQGNPQSEARAAGFASALKHAYSLAGHDVTWSRPELIWDDDDIKRFDVVVVGISPLLSLSANYAYGALSVMERADALNRLVLFVDAPDLSKVVTSLRVVSEDHGRLVKGLFSKRPSFRGAVEDLSRLTRIVDKLAAGEWPATLVPVFPWQDLSAGALAPLRSAMIDPYRMVPIHADWFTATPDGPAMTDETPYWAAETRDRGQYRKYGLSIPVKPVSGDGWYNDVRAQRVVASARGTLVEPTQRGSFWTPLVRLSLRELTPVYVDWRETEVLGDAWSMLPAAIERLGSKRHALANDQYVSYVDAMPSREDTTDKLVNVLELA